MQVHASKQKQPAGRKQASKASWLGSEQLQGTQLKTKAMSACFFRRASPAGQKSNGR